MAVQTSTVPDRPLSWRSWLAAISPGAVFVLSTVGPQDLVSNAAMGASYGYSALWAFVLILVVRFAVLESSARYVVVTGESLLSGYQRAGRWVPWMIFVALILKRHLSNMSQLLLLGAFAHLLVPLPFAASPKIWSIALWTLGFVLMFWGRYEAVRKISKPLVAFLGAPLLAVAVLSKPSAAGIASGFWPQLPADRGPYAFLFLLMSLVGSSAGSMGNLKYAAFVHETGWRTSEVLKKQRLDLIVSVSAIFVMGALIQIAAAAVLRPAGAAVVEVEDMVPIFSTFLGYAGRLVLGAGILAAVFNVYLGTNTGYSMVVADIWHNCIRKRAETEISVTQSRLPAYRWCLLWFCLSPVYVLFTNWKPVWITLVGTALVVPLLPLVLLVLLRLNNDKRLLGAHANGLVANTVLIAAAVAACLLAWQNAVDFWGRDLARLLGA